jgi:uncharacterized protein (DUF1015 family)
MLGLDPDTIKFLSGDIVKHEDCLSEWEKERIRSPEAAS